MTKKIKNTTILFIISLYSIGMIVSCSGPFLQHYQMVRYENKVHQLSNPTQLSFTEKEWLKFKNESEIFHKNEYYDIISFKKDNNLIIVKAFKDTTENHFRVLVNQVLKKHTKPFNENKINLSLSKHLFTTNHFNFETNSKSKIHINHSFDLYSFQKTKNYIFVLENPPC